MGELARKPGAPDVAKTPMELLSLREGEGFTFLDYYGAPVGMAAFSVCGIAIANVASKRPLWAGVHLYLLAGGIAYAFGAKWRDIKMQNRSEEVGILKHYVSLHPEDFPPFERRRVKDLFVPWQPIR